MGEIPERGFDLKNWLANFDNDGCKEALLKKAGMPDELILEEIYITDVAMAIYLQWNGDENVGRDNSISEEDWLERIKQALGELLRMISGYAEQSGLVLPVLGVIEIPENQKGLKEFIDRLAADQDWHRGDFSLFRTANKDKSLELIIRLLSNLFTVWADVKPLERFTTKQFLSKLQEERRVEKISQERESLLDTVMASLSEEKPVDQTVMQWLDNRLQDVDRLLAGE